MVRVLQGERIGAGGTLAVGCVAAIFDAARQRLLLTRRADNGQWCLPGGHMEPGESAAEACAREVQEETGLRVRITHLIGVYSSPHVLLAYPDGQRQQMVGLSFLAEPMGGALGLSDETTAADYFTPTEIAALDVMPHHRERIADAFAGQVAAFVR
ncbi:MAG TPA: NUDIX domain-containing protein [Ktedonobacterales bacterium]|nr:NUDIX domain-containing protein [Ktedonobacterales bacterium]